MWHEMIWWNNAASSCMCLCVCEWVYCTGHSGYPGWRYSGPRSHAVGHSNEFFIGLFSHSGYLYKFFSFASFMLSLLLLLLLFFFRFFAQFPWPVWLVWGLGMQGNSHDLITQFSYCQRCRSETSFTAKCMWVQRGICLMVVVVVPLCWLQWLQCEVRGDVAALSVSRGYYH